PRVGGGFGAKLDVPVEVVVVAAVAMRLRRPVKWVETRTESLQAMCHGRGQVQHVELGMGRDGRITGLRARVLGDAGAYMGFGGLGAMTGMMSQGPYRIPKIDFRHTSVVTNATPTGAY